MPCLAELPCPLRKTLRALGFEITALLKAGQVLLARMRNETLPPTLGPFTRALSSSDRVSGDAYPLDFQVILREGEVRFAEIPFPPVPLALLALFRLPALREFWIRELRGSHFHRLERVLPRVWFVTEDPPVGSVVPGLDLISWREVVVHPELKRVEIGGIEFAIESPAASPATLKLSYRRVLAE